MRVVVTTGPLAGLTSAESGSALAIAWADLGVQVAVVPIGEPGLGFARAWADLTGAEAIDDLGGVLAGPAGLVVQAPPVSDGSSAPLGRLVTDALRWAAADGRPIDEVWLEVGDFDWADGGEGFWQATEAVRPQLAAAALHLVARGDELPLHLTGFRGITAANGRARGMHPGDMLAADQALVDWCTSLTDAELGTTEGSGAAGGLGAVVLALSGDVVTGPAECARIARLAETMSLADLVVTGYDQLDFGSKGGDLVPLVSELAEQAMRPVIAVACQNFISAREMRTMGIEQGYALMGTGQQGGSEPASAITEAARSIAQSWHW